MWGEAKGKASEQPESRTAARRAEEGAPRRGERQEEARQLSHTMAQGGGMWETPAASEKPSSLNLSLLIRETGIKSTALSKR